MPSLGVVRRRVAGSDSTTAVERRLVGGAGVQPGVDADGMALAPLGLTMTLPNVATALVPGRLDARGVHRRREGQHRIAPVDQPSRAGMVGLAAEGELPSAVRPDRRGHGDRAVDQVL